MITLQSLLFLISMIGLAANGYFFRRMNLVGAVCGFLMTIPSTTYTLLNHTPSEMVDFTPTELIVSTSIALFIWGFGYCVAWITEK